MTKVKKESTKTQEVNPPPPNVNGEGTVNPLVETPTSPNENSTQPEESGPSLICVPESELQSAIETLESILTADAYKKNMLVALLRSWQK